MKPAPDTEFNRKYEIHLQHLRLKGLQPKTIDAYARAIRRIGAYFDHRIDDLSEQQLTDYFTALLASHSWSAVKLDLYGLKFYYAHVLHKPWVAVDLIKPPKCQRLPDIVTLEEVERLFLSTRILSYRVFFFTLYSLGLRLGEGLRLEVGDINQSGTDYVLARSWPTPAVPALARKPPMKRMTMRRWSAMRRIPPTGNFLISWPAGVNTKRPFILSLRVRNPHRKANIYAPKFRQESAHGARPCLTAGEFIDGCSARTIRPVIRAW